MASTGIERVKSGWEGLKSALQDLAVEDKGGYSEIRPHEWWAKVALVGINVSPWATGGQWEDDEAISQAVLELNRGSFEDIGSVVLDRIDFNSREGYPVSSAQTVRTHDAVGDTLAQARRSNITRIHSFCGAENLSTDSLWGHLSPPYRRWRESGELAAYSSPSEPSEFLVEAPWKPTCIGPTYYNPEHNRFAIDPVLKLVHDVRAKYPDRSMGYIGVVDMRRLDPSFGVPLVFDVSRRQGGVVIMPDAQGENWSMVVGAN